MKTSVLTTKFFMPTRRPDVVVRDRLSACLDRTLEPGRRLTLVSAPAGFGKTTVLSEWIAHLDERGAGVGFGWLSLDEGDNDPVRFLAHLVAALERTGLGSADGGPRMAAGGWVPDDLGRLINAISSAGEQVTAPPVVVVVDDYHAITSPQVHESVAFLVDYLPECLRLVVATRADPPLPLSRLRARHQLVELRASDLRFTSPEAWQFLNNGMGLQLSTEDVAALDERTEGWIAGLQLAALCLREVQERNEVVTFIEGFAGSNRFVIDYLTDEVLARQPREVREFLLRTSILDRLSGGLCDAVAGCDDGRSMLERLERANLFVVPLDDHRGWYRYHHLFADVLSVRLLAEEPDEVLKLHRRASGWYAIHDSPVPAVRHALAAEEFGRAAQLMEEALPDLRRARQDGLLLMWMQSLPESVVRRSPVLAIWSAWSELMSGHLDAMEHWLDDAEVALQAGAQDPDLTRGWADTEDLRMAPATISIYRASLAQARGDVPGTVQHARRALELAGIQDHLIRGQGGAFLALAAWAEGDIPVALETFGAAIRSLHIAGNLVDELDATIVLADMWVALSRPGRARELYEHSLEQATAAGEPYPRATADLHVGLAELDLELDDLASARRHLDEAQVLAQRSSITENRHRAHVVMAQVCATAGDHDEAQRLLEHAETLYRRGFYPEIRPIPALRARMQIAAGDLASASDWRRVAGVDVDDEPDYLHEYEHLTLVRLLLAEHRAGSATDRPGDGVPPAAAALELLDRLQVAAARAGRTGSLLEMRMLRALAHDANGDEPSAMAALKQAVETTLEPDSYVRLYVHEGTPMLDLLRRAVSRGGAAVPARLERRLVRATDGSPNVRPEQSLATPLSRRELDVLRLLDGELTGPDIARRLYVSLNTLRTHIKRIFTKLDVNNRAAAVRRARELGLL